MGQKLDRKSPGVVVSLIGAVAGVTLGALLALIHLASAPVSAVAALPKEPKEGVRYFVRGGGASGGGGWERKLDTLESGAGEAAFTEGELNAWSQGRFEQKKREEKSAPAVELVAGVPNFRMADRELQIGLENKLHFFGGEAPLVLQARGQVVRAGSGWRFEPREAYLGGLPLHRMPALYEAVAERFAQPAPEELAKLLGRAESISVVDDSLVVRVR